MTQPDSFLPGAPRTLANRTSEAIGRNPDRRTGTVLSFTSGALSVQIAGGAVVNAGYLDSYEPQVGDVVAVVLQRSTWLCLGRMPAEGASGIPVGGLLGGVLFLSQHVLVLNNAVEQLAPFYSFTVDIPENRLVRLYAEFFTSTTVNGDTPLMRLRETGLAGTALYGAYAPTVNGNNPSQHSIDIWFKSSAAVTKTYVMTAQRPLGVATMAIISTGVFGLFDIGVARNLTIVP